jgi:RNA polymerase sigma factor (sigma-70 family)
MSMQTLPEDPSLEHLVTAARQGDRSALEDLVQQIQSRVYNLALRMSANPEDARDATQEILILVVTKLSTFEGRSRFMTWVYRVSANYLLNSKKVKARELGLSFEAFGEDLLSGLVDDSAVRHNAETRVLHNELRLSCTMAMLLCLDPKHRLAYVLGEILELSHGEASEILAISRDNFRKRLSRARSAVHAFTARSCGIVNAKAPCHCPRRLPAALAAGRVQSHRTPLADTSDDDYATIVHEVRRLEGELRALKLHRSVPQFESPEHFGAMVAQLIEGQAPN